jgi:aspartate aminotransferase-like enzyme
MSLLPDCERILLGPGPSPTSPRVMRAMAAPTIGHLDPQMTGLLDDVRAPVVVSGGSVPRLIVLLPGALEHALAAQGHRPVHA